MQSGEAHVAGQHHRQDELICWHDPGLPLDFQRLFHQLTESEFLQQRAHGEQAPVGGQILTVEIIRRGRADFIGFRGDLLQALIYGGFVAILFSVCNHLGDLPGVGFAKRLLRKLLFYPNINGVPKWYTTLPPSCRKPQGRIGQVTTDFTRTTMASTCKGSGTWLRTIAYPVSAMR